MLATGALNLSSFPEESLQSNLVLYIQNFFLALLKEAAVAQGTQDQQFREGRKPGRGRPGRDRGEQQLRFHHRHRVAGLYRPGAGGRQ